MPEKQLWLRMGGGFSTDGNLAYGESWATTLELPQFVDIDIPGEYVVEILYHDQIPIADCDDIDGLIVSKSAPFRLSVQPITIKRSDKRHQEIAGWIAKLPNEGPVKVVDGPYGESGARFHSA